MDRHRPTIMGSNGAIASGHPLASAAGLRVMQEGGNAFDAAIAAAAVLAVCKVAMTGIGGHNLAVLWNARTEELWAMDANGPAPAAATLDRYAGGIPRHGPPAVSVPGTVAGWESVLSRFGTRRLGDLLQPAIGYARQGFPVNHLLSADIAQMQDQLRRWPTTAAALLPGDRVPAATDLLRQPQLAGSLALIAQRGASVFYEGELAQRIGEAVTAAGGLIQARDLNGFQPRWSAPLHTTYRGLDWYGQPPPSQGFIIGQELNVFEGFDPHSMSEVERIHAMVEAKKLAFADRARYLCDPDFHPVPLEQLLAKDHAERQRRRIGSSAAGNVLAPDLLPTGGETTYLCAMDAQGNAVSFIQSLFQPFGSYFMAGDTGILLNNRMTGFSVEPGHPNVVEPRKRPAMTLNTCMLFRDGRPWTVYGTPGADAQVQTNFQHTVAFVDLELDVQAAIERPRWRHLPDGSLLLEGRFAPDVVEGLRAKGHRVTVGEPWESETGGAQAIMIDQRTSVLQAGADPRREGYALAF